MQPINPPPTSNKSMSKAMIVETGKMLILSGHVPMTSDGELVGMGIKEQTEQVFENIGAALIEAGASFKDLVKITIFLCPMTPETLNGFREVRDRYINLDCPPTSSLVGVSALVNPDFLVEIEAMAELPNS
jgi:2-iminobutanoate/2-iminopropanoate deaminase